MEDEAREMAGFDALKADDEKRELSYWKLIEEPLAMLKAASSPTSPMASSAANNMQTSMEPSDIEMGQMNKEREIKTKPIPRPIPKKKDVLLFSPKIVLKDNLISDAFNTLLNDIKFHIKNKTPQGWIKGIIDAWRRDITLRLISVAIIMFREGISSLNVDRWEHDFTEHLREVESSINSTIQRLAFDLASTLDKIDPDARNREIMSAIDIGMNRLNSIFVTEQDAAFSRGRIAAMQILGLTHAKSQIDSNSSCEDCIAASKLTLDLSTVNIKQIPPHHPFCRCRIVPLGESNV